MNTRLALILVLLLGVLLPRTALSQVTGAAPPASTSRDASAFAAIPSPLAAAADNPGLDPEAALANPLRILSAAGDALGARGGSPGKSEPGTGLSASLNVLIVLTVVSLAPSIMLMTTCFVRIVIVLGLLKQALGTQTLPPPQVVVGLALFMTLIVMAPTLDRIHREAIVPYHNGQIRDYDTLWDRSKQPIRDFMFDQIEATGNWSSLYMVLNYRGIDTSNPSKLTTADVDLISLAPAFILSELKTGFLIGFKVYLPFLVIDMVISALLISMGMMMLPPVLISLPFKLLLFVLVDGWQLVVGSLMQSFVTHPAIEPAQHALSGLAQFVTG